MCVCACVHCKIFFTDLAKKKNLAQNFFLDILTFFRPRKQLLAIFQPFLDQLGRNFFLGLKPLFRPFWPILGPENNFWPYFSPYMQKHEDLRIWAPRKNMLWRRLKAIWRRLKAIWHRLEGIWHRLRGIWHRWTDYTIHPYSLWDLDPLVKYHALVFASNFKLHRI